MSKYKDQGYIYDHIIDSITSIFKDPIMIMETIKAYRRCTDVELLADCEEYVEDMPENEDWLKVAARAEYFLIRTIEKAIGEQCSTTSTKGVQQ